MKFIAKTIFNECSDNDEFFTLFPLFNCHTVEEWPHLRCNYFIDFNLGDKLYCIISLVDVNQWFYCHKLSLPSDV